MYKLIKTVRYYKNVGGIDMRRIHENPLKTKLIHNPLLTA